MKKQNKTKYQNEGDFLWNIWNIKKNIRDGQ